MICLAVTYRIAPGREGEAAEHFRRLVPLSRAEPGCVVYVVHRVEDHPRMFFLYEQYADRPALDAHRASPHFMEHVANGVRKIAEPPDVLICTPLTD